MITSALKRAAGARRASNPRGSWTPQAQEVQQEAAERFGMGDETDVEELPGQRIGDDCAKDGPSVVLLPRVPPLPRKVVGQSAAPHGYEGGEEEEAGVRGGEGRVEESEVDDVDDGGDAPDLVNL
eukprot:CAMPEP_0114116446 /NCGR_PEP_ID=MMETSP0043_2-20121206/4503_1 /TAXON_ID=464988 /ORGANISM="Hemiselmis andersenii, Strain CCMP644" /LENGTH=124 /DNA_ID=CAMNT_0001208769 /DNA_START=30 /DNA_END=406 /DNA_ORIENTATION=-